MTQKNRMKILFLPPFRMMKDVKKIKAISCELSAASQLFFYDLNHYDKRVFSIALRAPAAPSDGGRSGITRSDDEGSLS
jgi:hypothetical protein